MIRPFGTLADGRSVEAITLGDEGGLNVEVLTYGAILRRLSYPVHGQRRDLVLNFDRLEHYERDRAYVGSLVGVLTLGIVQTLIMFDGTLSSWWTRIVIGALLFAFCLLQRLTQGRAED